MGSTSTATSKLTFIKMPKFKKRDAYQYEQPVTKEEFLQILKDGDERFARGEYYDDVWALEEEARERVYRFFHE